jgi:hypothetical protein
MILVLLEVLLNPVPLQAPEVLVVLRLPVLLQVLEVLMHPVLLEVPEVPKVLQLPVLR